MTDVTLVASPDAALESLVARALDSLDSLRGGPQMRRDIEARVGAGDASALTRALAASHCLLGARAEGAWIGVAALSTGPTTTVLGVFVDEPSRRQGVGLALVRAARDQCRACDGWASPGDRATKSLYEAAGWRARLLTMSDGES